MKTSHLRTELDLGNKRGEGGGDGGGACGGAEVERGSVKKFQRAKNVKLYECFLNF